MQSAYTCTKYCLRILTSDRLSAQMQRVFTKALRCTLFTQFKLSKHIIPAVNTVHFQGFATNKKLFKMSYTIVERGGLNTTGYKVFFSKYLTVWILTIQRPKEKHIPVRFFVLFIFFPNKTIGVRNRTIINLLDFSLAFLRKKNMFSYILLLYNDKRSTIVWEYGSDSYGI